MSQSEKEIEAKFYILDLDKVRMRLQSLEAHLIQERVLETNIRFDLPDGGLRSEGRVLRLRQDTEAKLTYKAPGTNEQGVLTRTEIEFTVEDYEKAKQFIEALGYQKLVYYEKYRTTYELDGCHVMLDELPYGNFVEIEGEGVESIKTIAYKLNLHMDKAVPASYHMLFIHLCEAHPELDPSELSFNALKGLNVLAEELSVHAADV
jgi:adenylate cyclase class 2